MNYHAVVTKIFKISEMSNGIIKGRLVFNQRKEANINYARLFKDLKPC